MECIVWIMSHGGYRTIDAYDRCRMKVSLKCHVLSSHPSSTDVPRLDALQYLVVSPQQKSIDQTVLREVLVPLVVQMHREYFAQDFIQPTMFPASHTHSPRAVLWIGQEGVRQTVVQTTRSTIGEAEWENFEGRYSSVEKASP